MSQPPDPAPGSEAKEERLKFAEMWDCGDEFCNCTQPRIYLRSRCNFGESRWQPPELIAEGPFYSDANDLESREQKLWLLHASRTHQVANLAEIEKVYAPER